MSDVTVTQVARNFAEYVNRVAYRRESFTLVRVKKPIAELRQLPCWRASLAVALATRLPAAAVGGRGRRLRRGPRGFGQRTRRGA